MTKPAKVEVVTVETAAVPAVYTPQPVGVVEFDNGLKFVVKKQITRTVLRQIENEPFYIEFETAAAEGEKLEGSKMQPARLCNVHNLDTNAKELLIMNTVLEKELDKAYPDQSYVGKAFAIRSKVNDRGEGNKYRIYEIAELERI